MMPVEVLLQNGDNDKESLKMLTFLQNMNGSGSYNMFGIHGLNNKALEHEK